VPRIGVAGAKILADASPDYPPFLHLLGILRRRVRLVLAVAICGTALVVALGFVIPAKYTAKVELLVEPQGVMAKGETGVAPTAADEPTIDTQVTLLASRDHLRRVIESLSHDAQGARSEATAAAGPGSATPTGAEPSTVPGAARTGILTLEDLERHLHIAQERTSRVIGVSYTSTSSTEAALIANRIVQLYIENQRRQKQEFASRELAQLEERITELKKDVEESKAAVQALLQRRPPLGPPSAGDAQTMEARLRELEQMAVAREQLYDGLLRREKEVRYLQAVAAPDVRILSLASPPDRPSSTNPLLFALPAPIIFSIAGCFLALARERLDRGIRSQYELSSALGIPCLGLVPQLSRMGRHSTYKYLLRQPFGAYSEAMRSLVAALQLMLPHPPAKVILTSSAVPGEGKTTLAVSLAIYVTLLQRRTLLVDLDFRRPSILHALRARARRGVADVLLSDVPPAEVIQRIPRLGLDYLAMKRCMVDPVLLFADGRLPRLLRQLRDAYDCIIIDGPPLLGITESRLLAGLADKVLFLVKWGTTPREVAQSGINLLRDVGCFDKERACQPCAVLTQVNLNQHARYRYGDVGEYYAKDIQYYGGRLVYDRYKLEGPKDEVPLNIAIESIEERLPET
jgi:Mrp family chromosome partitioning ATPase/capsular polysaccharide biosynthesis protein